MNEKDLLSQAVAGSKDAFESVLQPHLPMLLAYSRAICGDYHIAEDVVQETALIAYSNLNHFFPEADFASWLKAIARRQALGAQRKSARMRPLLEQAVETAFQDVRPEALANERAILSECIQLLGERSGQIVREHYFNGQTLADLASTLNLNLNTVKTVLSRARASLAVCMHRHLKRENGV